MTNEDLAKVFEEIADLLELREENTYRVVAYRNAVRELRATGYDVPALLAAGEALPKMPGIDAELTGGGPRRVRLFHERLGVGSVEELEQAIRAGRLRRLGGFGPKSEQRILEAIQQVKFAHARRP